MNRFLHYFPAFRSMEREIQDLAGRLILAEDQARLWRSRCEAAEEREQRTADAKDVALKMVANTFSLHAGLSAVPFPDVYVPMPEPKQEAPSEPEPRKRQIRDLMRDAEAEYRTEFAAYIDKEIAGRGSS